MATQEILLAAREAQRRGAWDESYEAFAQADLEVPLGVNDLEAWATSAFLLGRQDAYEGLLDRAHQRYLDRGDLPRAALSAFWLALSLAGVGATSQASGWFARAKRLLASVEERTVAHGYLELAQALAAVGQGRLDDAYSAGAEAIESGNHFADPDLTALALQLAGRVQLRRAEVADGLALLDEAMVVVASGALRPQAAGIVYCSVIDGCRDIYSLRRANEWTAALTSWCEKQPELVAFTGECRVARAEMLILSGAWHDALAEASRAGERPPRWSAQKIRAAAAYQQAEVARLSGDLVAAERGYAAAIRAGGRSQPGLGLLRLAQGDLTAAERGVAAALDETSDPLKRARLLPALVDISLASHAADEASDSAALARAAEAAGELATITAAFAADFGGPSHDLALITMTDHALGAVALAKGDAPAAATRLRAAAAGWRELSAPYELAKVRSLLGASLRQLGDGDGAQMEFAAALETFDELGALPDLAHLERVMALPSASPLAPYAAYSRPPDDSGLTNRELEVLAGLAAGDTNRAIAETLDISERTVDRHVSNIFDKLGVSSRTEAATYAVRHQLA